MIKFILILAGIILFIIIPVVNDAKSKESKSKATINCLKEHRNDCVWLLYDLSSKNTYKLFEIHKYTDLSEFENISSEDIRDGQELLGEAICFGSHNDCDITYKNKHVSRKHFEIYSVMYRLGPIVDYFIVDLNSKNGTWLNGEKMEPKRPYKISLNDLICVAGIYEFKFVIGKAIENKDKNKVYTIDNSANIISQSENAERKTTITTAKDINSSKTDFSLIPKYIANKSIQYAEIYPLIVISEFLIEKGFSFQRVNIGGGFNEITHTGDAAYHAQYTDFNDFRDNFESDFKKAEIYECEKTGGWVTSLNYGYICVSLKKQSLSVIVTNDILDGNLYVKWSYSEDSDIACITEINNDIKDLPVFNDGFQGIE